MHALKVHKMCSFEFFPYAWVHAQKWIGSFHLKTEGIAGTKIKFHHHTFHKKNALPEKYFSSYDFLELKYTICSKYCKASIYAESKQSSSRNFKYNNFSLKQTKAENRRRQKM